jgi:hypothetical protein
MTDTPASYEKTDTPLPPYDKGEEGHIQDNPISRSSNVEHEAGPGREISEEERDGVPATDMEASSPLGVGESSSRRGEEIGAGAESGRRDAGTTGQAQRPAGTSTERDSTTIDPQEPIDPESPNLQRGDQGG